MLDFQRTIISQYSTAPTLNQLLFGWNENLDPGVLIDLFYNQVWNVDTAVGWGLDVWGRIVGVGRVLELAAEKYLGFEEATTLSADPFNQSPFYSGQQTTSNFILADDGFRVLILAKAAANIWDGSIPGLNQILLLLFPDRGNCYVIDNRDMTMTYFFDFELTPVELAIVLQSGVLPKPAGVSATVASSYINRIELEGGSGRIMLESGFGAIELEAS